MVKPPLPSVLQSSQGGVILLIGLPGSGKSTLAQTWIQQDPSWHWLSSDRLRGQLFGDEATQGPWPVLWAALTQQFQQTHGAIHRGEAHGLIYDATNVRRRSRRQVLQTLQEIGFGGPKAPIVGVWVTVDLEICLARNAERDRQVPTEVITQMHRQLLGAPPSLQEGFDNLWQIANPDRP